MKSEKMYSVAIRKKQAQHDFFWNHEDYLLQPNLTFFQRMAWDRVGRRASVKSFKAHGARMEDAVLTRNVLPCTATAG